MTELTGEELDRKIAPIAGLVEGKDFWGPQEHDVHFGVETRQYVCGRCFRHSGYEFVLKENKCHKPPPAYHESLDLLLPVVRGLDKLDRAMVAKALVERIPALNKDQERSIFGIAMLGIAKLLELDNPARLLAEALVEAVGEKE